LITLNLDFPHQWRWLRLLVLMLPLVSNIGFAKGINSSIEKSDLSSWTVSYQANEPIKKIAFISNPDDSRVTRWSPVDRDFQIIVVNGEEFIVRKDSKEFTQVTISLTATYKHLPKEYAPFSPFSDGGMSFYTGRFFACANECNEDLNQWTFDLSVPAGEHIIIDGKKVLSATNWVDSNSGRNIYVGRQTPVETNGFVSLIDVGLPEKIRASLLVDIPKMTSYLESRLGKLTEEIKPTLFASYSKVKGTSVQGGVLPNQIFIHWDKDDLEKFTEDESFIGDLLWTFAHEVGHYYQRFNSFKITPSESWIHEGHAELLAYDVLSELYPSADRYRRKKIDRFEQDCAKDLESTSLEDAAINGKFSAYYSCGFLIHQLISKGHQNGASPYATWKLFSSKLEVGPGTNKRAFLDTVTQLTNENLSKEISRFISMKHTNGRRAVALLIDQ
jgi:hypothetical protein